MTCIDPKPGACQGCGLIDRPLVSDDGSRTPDILIVGGFPLEADTTRGAFTSRSGAVIRSIVSNLRKKYGHLEVQYTYAVRCCPEGVKPKVKVETIDQCRPFMEMTLAKCKPKILILLGSDAMKSLNMQTLLKDSRGVRSEIRLGAHRAVVIPTYSQAAIMAKPGILPVVEGDFEKAFSYVKNLEAAATEFDIRIGKTWPEVKGILEEVATFIASKPRKWAVSLDTETTSLIPSNPEDRVFCISFSTEDNLGYSIRFDRRGFAVSQEEFDSLPPEEQELVCSPERFAELKGLLERAFGNTEKLCLVEYNSKFDTQWLVHHYGLKLAPVMVDPMLWEHALCEDKKGEYSLKDLTVDYFPAYGKYEAGLQAELDRLETEKEKAFSAIEKEWRDTEMALKMTAFMGTPDERRVSLVGRAAEHGFISMETAMALQDLKQAKPKKMMTNLTPEVAEVLTKLKLILGGKEKSLEAFVTKLFKTKKSQATLAAVFASGELSERDTEVLHGFTPEYGEETGLSKQSIALLKKTLKSVPREFLGAGDNQVVIPDKEAFTRVTYEELPEDLLMKYAAVDAIITRKLVGLHMQQAAQDTDKINAVGAKCGRALATKTLKWAMENITLPLCEVLGKMEYHGVRIDRDRLQEYIPLLDAKLTEYSELLKRHVGLTNFNPNSGAELANYIYNTLKLPVIKVSETSGAPSVDADTLKELADNHPSEFLETLLSYRKIHMCRNTFLENWLVKSARDGKLHCNFHQTGTATHRLSSSNPNLQNVPFFLKEAKLNLKALFIPDSEEYDIYDLDISNAEMRVLAGYSQDEALTAVFNNKMCMHCLTGSAISEFEYEDIYENKERHATPQYKMRQIAKTVNFGTVYCMSNKTLQRNLWTKMRVEVTDEEAQSYLDKFFEKYPGVQRYIESTKAFVRRFGFHYTYTGRRRRFPIAMHSSSMANRVSRQAVNARIQTTSSDLVNMNIVDLDKEITRRGGRILLTVHDSIVFQLPKGQTGLKTELDRLIIENTAERNPWLPVRWEYGVGMGRSYGEAKNPVLD